MRCATGSLTGFDGQTVYRDLTRPDEPLGKAEYEWETASLPEGTYRIRVEATDEIGQPPDRVFRHSARVADRPRR